MVNVLNHRHFLVALFTALFTLASGYVHAQGNVKLKRYALVTADSGAAADNPLKFSVENSIILARELVRHEFDVRCLVDPTSFKNVQEKLKDIAPRMSVLKMPNKDNGPIRTVKSGKELEAAVIDWMQEVRKQQPDLCIFSFAGHGVERVDARQVKTQFLLTGTDAPDEDGANMRKMMTKSEGLKLVMLVDCCRRPPDPPAKANGGKAVDPEANANALIKGFMEIPENRRSISRTEESQSPHEIWRKASAHVTIRGSKQTETPINGAKPTLGPTVFYSAWSGKEALDLNSDLIRGVALALSRKPPKGKPEKEVEQLLAVFYKKNPATSLDIGGMFFIGYWGIYNRTVGTQGFDISYGAVRPDFVVCRLDTGRQVLPQFTDLLLCNPTVEPSPLEGELTEDGPVVTRRPKTMGMHQFCAFRFHNGDKIDFPVASMLVLDLAAVRSPMKQVPKNVESSGVHFRVHVKNYPKDGDDSKQRFFNDENQEHSLAFDAVSTLFIPLKKNPEGRFNQIALLAPEKQPDGWPEGASIRILGMRLVDALDQPVKENPVVQKADVLQRWLPVCPVTEDGRILKAKDRVELATRIFTLSCPASVKGPLALGGPLEPSFYALTGNVLQLEAMSAADTEFTIELWNRPEDQNKPMRLLGTSKYDLKQSKDFKQLQPPMSITESGLANFFTVSTKSQSLTIRNVNVVPAVAAKAKK